MVTGIDGGFLEPGDDLYEALGQWFADHGTGAIFVEYRRPGELRASTCDALAGAQFLRERGASRFALVGWSFGGAVISHTAAELGPAAQTLVGLAAQSRDTEVLERFAGRSVYLVHDPADENVPFTAMEQIAAEVPPGVQVVARRVEGSNHALDGLGGLLRSEIPRWVLEDLCPRDAALR
jgi:predicted esterase